MNTYTLKLPVLGSLLFCGDGGQMLTNGGSMLPGSAENWPSRSSSSWRLCKRFTQLAR